MRFKSNKVWVATTPEGGLLEENGKMLIRYQLDQPYEYWVHKASIHPIDGKGPGGTATHGKRKTTGRPSRGRSPKGRNDAKEKEDPPPPGAICIYTDGASSGNPGPSGIGILLRFEDHEKEISRPIGIATNNIAELLAIKTGLLALKKTHLPVRIYTDSSYALGVLTRGWKARRNADLVNATKAVMSTFSDLRLAKVRGHMGNEGNEKADRLATAAVSMNPSERARGD